MAGLALIVAIIALIFSYLAYQRSGGSTEELRRKVDDLGFASEKWREKTADALNRLEKSVRGRKTDQTVEGEIVNEDRNDEGSGC